MRRSFRPGDGGQERVLRLPAVQPRVLDHHRHVGLDHAGAVGVEGDRLGEGEEVVAREKICTYSLDNGPLNESDEGNLTFRFTLFDWEKNIHDLLVRNNIHYDIVGQEEADVVHQLLKKNIYVAEDDPDILLCLRTILEDAGYHVRGSARGTPIVEGNYSSIDLFILDKALPTIDGLALCKFLKVKKETRHIPIIMISSYHKLKRRASEVGADDFLEKPFDVKVLLQQVEKHMQSKAQV